MWQKDCDQEAEYTYWILRVIHAIKKGYIPSVTGPSLTFKMHISKYGKSPVMEGEGESLHNQRRKKQLTKKLSYDL